MKPIQELPVLQVLPKPWLEDKRMELSAADEHSRPLVCRRKKNTRLKFIKYILVLMESCSKQSWHTKMCNLNATHTFAYKKVIESSRHKVKEEHSAFNNKKQPFLLFFWECSYCTKFIAKTRLAISSMSCFDCYTLSLYLLQFCSLVLQVFQSLWLRLEFDSLVWATVLFFQVDHLQQMIYLCKLPMCQKARLKNYSWLSFLLPLQYICPKKDMTKGK